MTTGTQHQRITTDFVWQRLIAILEDQAQTLIRTAFSTTTRESGDLSTGAFDRRGRMIAQAVTGTPGHVNSMALAVVHFLRRFPLDSLAPGDVLVSNDPWLCSGHLHDMTVVTPVFRGERAVALVANTVHMVDIGGTGFGAGAREVHEEGLCLPICKLARAGVADPVLMEIIAANVREAEQVLGDLESSLAGNAVAAARLTALLEEFGLDDLEAVSDAIIARTQRAVEARIAALPDGRYANHLRVDGFDEPIDLHITVTIAGPAMLLDFAGSSREATRGINVVLNYTTAYAVFGVNCVLNPDIPCNYGSLDPIRVAAPAGSILNAQRPAAVSARHMIGHLLPDLVLGALAQVLPVPAEAAGLIWMPSFAGRRSDGSSFSTVTFNAGGMGAQHDRDGWSATGFPSGVKTMPVETVEAAAPLLFRRKELRPDSGGAGQYRGGLGQIIEIEVDGETRLNAMFDRVVNPPRGRVGGRDGAAGRVALQSGKPVTAKGLQDLAAGEVLILELPGGAGFGDPALRDPAAIADDLLNGYVTEQGLES